MSTEKSDPRMFGPDRAVLVGLVERRLEALLGQGHLAAHENKGLGSADSVGAYDHALDQLVRVPSIRAWSLKVAGSLSSPLTTRYTG